jgi:hypothetical protein
MFLLGGLLKGTLSSAHADGTLTLELPPSQGALDSRTAAKAQAEAEAARARQTSSALHTPTTSPRASRGPRLPGWSSASADSGRTTYASRGAGVDGRVVGRLGQLGQTSSIYRGPSRRTGKLTTVPDRGSWYGILMADGSTGYLPKQNVQMLDYQVVAAGSAGSSGQPPLPTHADAGDIYPCSATPFFTGDPQALFREAYKYLGVHYVWGGNTANGIDCSGFVRNVFAACGYPLPRLGSDQMAYGIPVPVDQLQPGDRLYFGRRKERLGVTHTGLYIGNGYFIHSSSSRHGVAISRLSEPMYARIYVCARR